MNNSKLHSNLEDSLKGKTYEEIDKILQKEHGVSMFWIMHSIEECEKEDSSIQEIYDGGWYYRFGDDM